MTRCAFFRALPRAVCRLLPWIILAGGLFGPDARADSFDELRQKWFVSLTGGTNHNLADAQVQNLIRGITNAALNQWTNLNKAPGRPHLWADLTSTTDSSELTTAYNRILDMAEGYATWGGALFTNAALAADIAGAMDWMYANRYNESKVAYDNWWDWEIGSPMALNDACVMVYPALTGAQLTNFARATARFTPGPALTGANLVWKTRVAALRAALIKDAALLGSCRDAFSQLFPYVTGGDGFYTDGSFIQHGKHPYAGGYGSALIGSLAVMLPWLEGSPWQVVDPARTNVVNWLFDSFQPVLYRGALMDMVRGREISRSYSDHSSGRSVVDSMLRIAEFAGPAEAARLRSLVKHYTQADTTVTWTNFGGLTMLSKFRALLADPAIFPLPEPIFHKPFPSMDCVVHTRPGWGLGIRMSSTRIYTYESINGENLRAWFTGDGMTYLYNGDLNQFGDGFWPTADPYRLPGTTVDTAPRANGSGQGTTPARPWSGGAELDGFGVAGMELDAFGSTLAARKSWFCLDDEVVCLGAGVTGGSGAVRTTVEHRRLGSAGTNEFQVNGLAAPPAPGWTSNLTGVGSAWLQGAGGYFFPGGASLSAQREARTGAYRDINDGGSTNPITRNYLSLWFDHGVNPSGAAYAYALLPNKTAAETTNYAARPHFVVLENSTQVQAVRETNLNVVAANFWNAGARTVDLLTASGQAAVLTRETSGGLWLGVADPTQTNTGSVTLTLNRSAIALGAADPGVTIVRLTPTIQVTVNLAGRRGRTARAVFAYTTNSPPLVALTAPAANAVLAPGAIALAADASYPDGGGSVTRVEFFAGTVKLGEATQPPYTWTWPDAAAGRYTLTARALDNTGRMATSAPVAIMVAAPARFIDTGSVWKFNDTGANLGTAWRALNAGESGWKSGPSMLGFGDANGLLPATLVASNRQITTYFRQKFEVPDPALVVALQLSVLRDDAAAVFLNGTEVWRDTNFPAGLITNTTPALAGLSGAAESLWLDAPVDPAWLVAGTNVLAVEVHQNSVTSSDLAFDLQLAGFVTGPNRPPAVALTNPAEGAFLNPASNAVLAAVAGDPDGTVALVEFFREGTRLGQSSAAPYTLAVTNLSLGTNVFHAVATDDLGLRTTSAVVRVVVGQWVPATLVASGAVWRYFDRTNDLGTAWRGAAFDDAAWNSGPAMLGFGDANGLLPATTVASNRQWTTYFRHQFHVPDASRVGSLGARLLRDDGAVVYLNGTEVWRDTNMPAGAILNATPALAAIASALESTWLTNTLDPAVLVTGTNVLAIEIHQNAVTSSDLAMNFELAGQVLVTMAPPLAIARSGGVTVLRWPADAVGFNLQAAAHLTAPVPWTPVAVPPVLNGAEWTLQLPLTNSPRFFRLEAR